MKNDNEGDYSKEESTATANAGDGTASVAKIEDTAEGATNETTAVATTTTTTTTSDDDEKNAAYDAYRRKYCLNFIRAFFNQHLDDSWFRALYSPAARQKWLQREHQRAVSEAQAMLQEITKPSFIEQAGLGGGQKQQQANSTGTLPISHLLSWQQPDSPTTALCISEIPPSVTDEQLLIALLNHADDAQVTLDDLTLYSSTTVPVHTSHRRHDAVLQRHAVVAAERGILDRLCKFLASTTNKTPPPAAAGVVPRRTDGTADDAPLVVWPLQVDCTDPYGRLQYDADGRGGAPADGAAVPPQKARVMVQFLGSGLRNGPPIATTPRNMVTTTATTTVLSAALSVRARHASDALAAQRMVRLLDEQRSIPSGWDVIHAQLFGDTADDDVVLDVCIAYLRRVHLVSFYHNCDQPATGGVVDVVTGKHAASTIRLRLQNADELLLETAAPDAPLAKDMLVQRLDDSIEKALTNFSSSSSWNSPYTLTPEQTQQAAEIEAAEGRVEDQWLRDHSIVDTDERARCSFHFCHKLFKDNQFLHKHLLKKHTEYLRAEQAKCHDPFMMKAWDAATDRSVPDILVDCGNRFGYVAASIAGQVPDCVDPEPELWKREEERRRQQEQMQARREETRQHAYNQGASPRDMESSRPGNFVDVDDMKDEKVEVSFDNVGVPVAAVKKKKKKRKLL